MRRFPIVNLGQFVQEFEGLPLDGDTLSRLCDAVNAWHNASSTSGGARTMRDAVADVRSILGPMNLTNRRAAEAQMRQACNRNPTFLLDQITFAQPPTAEQTTTAQTPFYSPGPTKPPPPYKPVASEDRYIPPDPEDYAPVASTYEPVTTTGSEAEPEPTPTPTPFPSQPPMVPTGGEGCWYTPGQGYSWGARPSGSETTGLNRSDCANIMRYDREIRGLPVATLQPEPVQAPQFTQESTPMTQAPMSPSLQPAIETRPDVASTMCPQGQFWDGRQCRGSVAPGFGNLMNIANMGPSGGVAAPTFGGEGFSSGGAPGAFSMGGRRRFPVVNL